MTVNRAGAFHKRMWKAVFWVNCDLSSFLHSRLQVRVHTALYRRKVQLFCMCCTSRWCFCTEVWNLLVDPTERADRLCPLPPRVSRFLPSDFMRSVQFLWRNDSPAFNLCISQVPGLTLSRVQSFKSHPALSSANALCSFWGLVSRVTLAWPSLGTRTWVRAALESPWITHWLSVQRWRRRMPERGFVLATVAPFLQKAASSVVLQSEWDTFMSFFCLHHKNPTMWLTFGLIGSAGSWAA